jgi:hypothetical protein
MEVGEKAAVNVEWTFGFHKLLRSSWVAASRVVLSFIVSWLVMTDSIMLDLLNDLWVLLSAHNSSLCSVFPFNSITYSLWHPSSSPFFVFWDKAVWWTEKAEPHSRFRVQHRYIWNLFRSFCLIYVNWKIMFVSCLLNYWANGLHFLIVMATGSVQACMKCNETFDLHSILLHIWQTICAHEYQPGICLIASWTLVTRYLLVTC